MRTVRKRQVTVGANTSKRTKVSRQYYFTFDNVERTTSNISLWFYHNIFENVKKRKRVNDCTYQNVSIF